MYSFWLDADARPCLGNYFVGAFVTFTNKFLWAADNVTWSTGERQKCYSLTEIKQPH